MKQFSYPTFCSATRALLSKFPTSSLLKFFQSVPYKVYIDFSSEDPHTSTVYFMQYIHFF